MSSTKKVDKVRASRDGHEFHETWAARMSLKLVIPNDGLVGIAVEGLSPADQQNATAEMVEIADLTLYYGEKPTFEDATSTIIIQMKYSISSADAPFCASDAKKTISKFANSYRQLKNNYGSDFINNKVTFEIITNRPVLSEFFTAVSGLNDEEQLNIDSNNQIEQSKVVEQLEQFKTACKLKGTDLKIFSKKFKIKGKEGTLHANKQDFLKTLANWTGSTDLLAKCRLGNLKQLVRDMAGSEGEGKNIITRMDVLAKLELQSPDELTPCPSNFVNVGNIVNRTAVVEIINQVAKLNKPLLILADGGIGKTVFLQAIAKALEVDHVTILFDCFGGGTYRSADGARHHPKQGMVHIANELACKGLSDPLLPGISETSLIVKAFRERLKQAITTIRRVAPGKLLILLIDAIDNAAEYAKDKGEPAFPKLLLESFDCNGPIDGVKLIVSCRPYRQEIATGGVQVEKFDLLPFNEVEVKNYLRTHIPEISDIHVKVALSRSNGNPRILKYLVLHRQLLVPSAMGQSIKLDDLINEHIQTALGEVRKQGHTESEIEVFLSGLAVLPSPVPLVEYAMFKRHRYKYRKKFYFRFSTLNRGNKIWNNVH